MTLLQIAGLAAGWYAAGGLVVIAGLAIFRDPPVELHQRDLVNAAIMALLGPVWLIVLLAVTLFDASESLADRLFGKGRDGRRLWPRAGREGGR